MSPDEATPAPNGRHCDRCGVVLPPDAPRGICPACLLQVGMESAPSADDDGTLTAGTTEKAAVPPKLPDPSLLRTGQQFGNYRIGDLLGKGGMGEVFEAEDIESGRRVALKVLRMRLDSPDARKRFLREGRMAAAINHPNSVYIYGTEEIDDQSVIAMELVERGTLKDKLKQGGAMSIGEAVDDILQVIAGLAAAHEKGVLHRDIKPSNCFVAADGSVKVGDFGLSVSSLAREDTQLTLTGTVMGTPAFASPEQLRGDELDVRSDIYSVGATLYFLLTGKAPLEAKNVVQMVATVLDKKPDSPRSLRPEIPEDLAELILRCLAKQPDARFRDYAGLQKALLPFSTRAVKPATLGLRTMAGAIDAMMIGLAVNGVVWMTGVSADPADYAAPNLSTVFAMLYLSAMLGRLLYFAVPESRWGMSLGKAVCRIQVVNRSGSRIGLVRSLARVIVFDLMTIGPAAGYMFVDPAGAMGMKPDPTALDIIFNYSFLLVLIVIFLRARRANGYAGLHDRLSDTRVIVNQPPQERSKVSTSKEPWPELRDAPRLGPYHALAPFDGAEVGEIVPAFDLMLRRQVWIRKADEGSEMLPAAERRRGRAGRIRWINGSRRDGESWDAYESLNGQPLVNMLRQPQDWATVRYWLLDLTREFNHAESDDSLPTRIGLEHVWITGDGHAKLLDFAAPGADSKTLKNSGVSTVGREEFNAGVFLKAVAEAALRRGSPPPLHAGEIIRGFPTTGTTKLIGELAAATERNAAVSRLRRFGLVIFCLLPVLMVMPGLWFSFHIFEKWERDNPAIRPLKQCLGRVAWLERNATNRWQNEQFGALKTYIAGEFRRTVAAPENWNNRFAVTMLSSSERARAEQLMQGPVPTAEELKTARQRLDQYLRRVEENLATERRSHTENRGGKILTSMVFVAIVLVVLPGLLAALACRGGMLMHFLGLTFVTQDGRKAKRWRILLRNLLVWSPILGVGIHVLKFGHGPLQIDVAVVAGFIFYGVLMLGTLLNPSRGLPDVVMGTWIVPR